jgi:DNA-binding IclR family transcriptional regulator
VKIPGSRRCAYFGLGVKKDSKNPTGEERSVYTVPAVDRAARIILMLAGSARGMTLAEIAAATGWHKSSVHKILITLGHHGFLDRDGETKRFVLGVGLLKCTQSVQNNLQISQSAKALLRELAEYSGETANLAILRGTKMVIVDVVESPVELRVSPPVGTMDLVTAKSNGKAVLAYLSDEYVSEILRTVGLSATTGNSIINTKLFRNELAAVRKKGYAIDIEEFQEGISAVSAPIFNSERQVLGTLSIIGPAFRMTKDKLQMYGKKCADAALRLSGMMH